MAREFDNSTSNYLRNQASAPVTGYPMSMHCLFNLDAVGFNTLISLCDKDSPAARNGLLMNSADPMAIAPFVGNSTRTASSNTVTLNTWNSGGFTAIDATAANKFVWCNGTSTVQAADYDWGAGTDEISIGCLGDSTPSSPCDGEIAEVGVWNRALAASEMAMLNARYSPLFFPRGLVFYSSLNDGATNERDYFGRTLSEVGTVTLTPHPRVIYPTWARAIFAPAAAPGGGYHNKLHTSKLFSKKLLGRVA